ncbi:topoisomerase IV subunit A [Bacillus sp. JCM 19047]|nr:topoisomerase IV subunit A [Bacillus sp. JCM 19047]
MNVKPGDYIVGFETFELEDTVEFLCVTQRGSVKRMAITEFEKSSRNKRGSVLLRELKSNPHRLVGFKKITPDTKLFLVETDQDEHIFVDPSKYRKADRYSNGSYAFDENDRGKARRLKVVIDTVDQE